MKICSFSKNMAISPASSNRWIQRLSQSK
jgi:hypothetical protein